MASSAKRQLLFEIGGHLFAVDAREAVEVVEPMQATPVPGAVAGVMGLINLRGMLMIAGDLAVLLGLTPEHDDEAALVVLERGERRIALRVDRVVGFAPFPEAGLDVESDLLEALGARDVVSGVGELGSRPYFQLDLEAAFGRVLAVSSDQSVRHGSIGGR